MFPMALNGTIDYASIKNNNTYYTNEGVSMAHIVNGMAGNVESHSTWDDAGYCVENCTNVAEPFTNVLNMANYGFTKLTVVNSTAAKFTFIEGDGGTVGDEFWLIKPNTNTTATSEPSPTMMKTSGTGRVGVAAVCWILAAAVYIL
jgi:hypothetical protein